MPINTAYMDRDLSGAITDLPVQVSYGNAQFEGIFDDSRRADELAMVGEFVNVDGTLICRVANFDTEPEGRQRIDIQRVGAQVFSSFRILDVSTSADGVAYTFTLQRWNRA